MTPYAEEVSSDIEAPYALPIQDSQSASRVSRASRAERSQMSKWTAIGLLCCVGTVLVIVIGTLYALAFIYYPIF